MDALCVRCSFYIVELADPSQMILSWLKNLLQKKICLKNKRIVHIVEKSRSLMKTLNGETLIKDAHWNSWMSSWPALEREKQKLTSSSFSHTRAHHFLTVLPFFPCTYPRGFLWIGTFSAHIMWLWTFWHWPSQVLLLFCASPKRTIESTDAQRVCDSLRASFAIFSNSESLMN